jgi:hypothetical protein
MAIDQSLCPKLPAPDPIATHSLPCVLFPHKDPIATEPYPCDIPPLDYLEHQ